ncbi:MmcQ/YjbR family DNA-binding protein [Peptostreptococcaceae bacterium AGR-M142]
MKIEEAIKYCLNKKGAKETYPFDEETLVFKVGNKMFGLVYDRNDEIGLNLKCDVDLSLALRHQYEGIIPGYHMNKKHWNTIIFDKDVPDEEIIRLINISYELVFKSLTKKVQKEIKEDKN